MSLLYDRLLRPALFGLPPETAHELGLGALRVGLGPGFMRRAAGHHYKLQFSYGPVSAFGLSFPNPLGVAAGFDKNGVAVDQLAALGFGAVEVGTVTFRPQPGNDRPRLFRLPDDFALINRFGFNNDGAERVAERLGGPHSCVVGVNIGKNKDTELDASVENYLSSMRTVFGVADYVSVNVSSPNTPNLRELQSETRLRDLLRALMDANRELGGPNGPKPLLLKIAPDLTDAETESIVSVALETGIAAIIATNTTVRRDGLKTRIDEAGGLSGLPLRARSTDLVRRIRTLSNGSIPIIGVGGIFSAEDAFEKIAAGATLVQAYTGFVYHGPGFARDIVGGLDRILRQRGFDDYSEAVGSDAG